MQHRRIIKRGPIILATDEDGSVSPSSPSSQGLFLSDTRYLSLFKIRVNDIEPVLLGSSEEDLFEASYLHTNAALPDIPERSLGCIHRNRIEGDEVVIDVTVLNWTLAPIKVEISIELDGDFFDSFEARGVQRVKRGAILTPMASGEMLDLHYVGLDGICNRTKIAVTPGMDRFENGRMIFPVALDGSERATIQLRITMTMEAPAGQAPPPGPVLGGASRPDWLERSARFDTSNAAIDSIVNRSVQDLEILLTEFPEAWVPAAGLPRFGVPFGRDSLFTGLETLTWNPELSRNVLRFLASRQGREENPWNYEQPGKIMHEMHTGELARLREVPFGLFYGSVDSTPLFLVLAAEYLQWTGDMNLYRELKPNLDAAWHWIDEYGNIDGSGYVQYKAHTPPKARSAALTVGLFNQGWKDSANSVAYGDGTMTTDHPIALAEVQGYLYRALHLWGKLYVSMPASEGMEAEGARLLMRAATLRKRFNEEFWMPEKSYFAMALDGHHRQVDSITSNPGHCLWTRLIDEEYADAVAATLVSPAMLSKWGIRSMGNREKAYNPFSYHNGSVWPFENALIASGLKRYGLVRQAEQVFDALVEATSYFEYRRWPEVYCGVAREIGGVLARQPDASRPQAWSAGAIFLLMQTWLGLAPRPFSRHIDLTPVLPAGIREMRVDNMSIAGTTLSLRVLREGNGTLVEARGNPGDLDVTIHPATRDHHRIDHDERRHGAAIAH